MSEEDDDEESMQIDTGVPDGLRRSGRQKGNKLKKANRRNERRVQDALYELEVSDVDSNEFDDESEGVTPEDKFIQLKDAPTLL